jgi:hypothetical protein
VPSPDIASEPEPVRPSAGDISISQSIFLIEVLSAAVVATYVVTESELVAVVVAVTALVTLALRRRG